jgi:hypothetical protein
MCFLFFASGYAKENKRLAVVFSPGNAIVLVES